MPKTIQIELIHTETNRSYHLHLNPQVTLQQLHHTILILFDWKDEEPFTFFTSDSTFHWFDKQIHDAITSLIPTSETMTYTYAEEEKANHITLHIKWLETSCKRTIELLDDNLGLIQYVELQKNLDALSIAQKVTKEQFTALLEEVRNQLQEVKTIAPCLLAFEQYDAIFPFYLDILDNGIELMTFPNETAFERSILNSSNEDPDLLFTYAMTFDFLYDEIQESDLPLFSQHTLCYKNVPGKLPQAFDEIEYYYAFVLLSKLHHVLHQTKHLPSFGDHKMMRIKHDLTYEICDVTIPSSPTSMLLTSSDAASLSKLPHTNEKYRLMLQAMPRPDSKQTHMLDIQLCAMNLQFHKEIKVNVTSIEELSGDVYRFLKQLFRERGLAEEIQISSCNLYHLVSNICEELDIRCSLCNYNTTCDASLIDMICEVMSMTQEDRLIMEPQQAMTSKLWN